MKSRYVKIFSILIFLVISFHFFHSEFDLLSCESGVDHHSSHDYCQLINNIIVMKVSTPAVQTIISEFHPGPILIHYDVPVNLTINHKTRDVSPPGSCPEYISNRIILI